MILINLLKQIKRIYILELDELQKINIIFKTDYEVSKQCNKTVILLHFHNHFVFVNKLNALMRDNNSKSHHNQYYCVDCLEKFTTDERQEKHKNYCR